MRIESVCKCGSYDGRDNVGSCCDRGKLEEISFMKELHESHLIEDANRQEGRSW